MSSLAEALVAAQAEMPAVEADARNPHFNSTFVSLDHLVAKTKPILTKHGLCITQWPTHINGLPALTTRLEHTSGEQREDTMPLLVDKNTMQGLGSAITYARRYAWSAALGICDEKDDDGNHATAQSSSPGEGAAGVAHPPAAPVTDAEWRWPSGKQQGKTLAETPTDYLEWYLNNGPKQDVRERIRTFVSINEQQVVGALEDMSDEGIPF